MSLLCCCCCCEQIPADPKLLVSRFEPEKLSQFFLTNIEQQPRRELLLPADVGVPIRYSMLVMTVAAGILLTAAVLAVLLTAMPSIMPGGTT